MPASHEPTPDSGQPLQTAWVPETAADREAVREQVGRVLSSALFRNSKRFPVFLRYTVEHALTSAEPLKERIIGHEVFARDPGYDTAQDPVVRMTAAEVRKRLAQYYQQPEHQLELLIGYEPGSYVPGFFQPARPTPAPLTTAAAEMAVTPAPVQTRLPLRAIAAVAAVVVAVAALAIVFTRQPPSGPADAVARLWGPLLAATSPVLICIGDPVRVSEQADAGQAGKPEDLTIAEFLRSNSVRYTDAVTLALLGGELRARGKAFRVRRPAGTDLKDLRDGPVVLIGGFNNAWTLRLSEGLRFTLATDAGGAYVRDRDHPDSRQWQPEQSDRLIRSLKQTYGLITRVEDPSTGHAVLTVSGVVLGTATAGECLIDAACLQAAERLDPGGLDRRNVQIVVSAPVIGQDSGAPQVVARHSW